MSTSRRSWLAAILLLSIAACSESLDVYNRVEDLRVLAIRAEPPEIFFDTPGAEAPSDVRFEALVVDPTGAPIDYAWSFCPVESSRACADFEARAAQADPSMQANLIELRSLSSAGRADPLATPFTSRTIAPFVVPTSELAKLEFYFLATNFFGLGTGAWPSAVLEVESPNDAVTSFKRLVVGIEDLTSYVESRFGHLPACGEGQDPAQHGCVPDLGLTVCEDGVGSTPEAPCVPLRPRVANLNPVFDTPPVYMAWGPRADAEFFDPQSDPLYLKAGDVIRLLPRFTPESSEPYQTLSADLKTGTITAQDLVEEISVAWFYTHGRVREPVTWPKFTKTLDTVYEAPQRLPDDEPLEVTLWLVARDQRGGVAWETVRIVVSP